MAHLFTTTGGADHLDVTTSLITAAPFTMACWERAHDITAHHFAMSIVDASTDEDFWACALRGDAGDTATMWVKGSGQEKTPTTTNTYTADVWHHICFREISTTSRDIILDADFGNRGTNTTLIVPANIDQMSIGRVGDSSPVACTDADIAEAAFWNVALTDGEVAAHAAGFSPLLIRPSALVLYRDLIRGINRPFIGPAMTLTGADTVVEHPRIIYPSSGRVTYFAPVVAGGVAPHLLTRPGLLAHQIRGGL